MSISLSFLQKNRQQPHAHDADIHANSHHHYQHIAVSHDDTLATATVTLNRPDKKNAMSFAMMRELIDVADTLKADKRLRVVVINGAGSDFCAGIDLADLNDSKQQVFAFWELIKPWQSLFQKVCLCWQNLPVPVIADIQGHCLGAGMQLALACDFRIASQDSKFAIMEAKWGLVADMGLTQAALGQLPKDTLKRLAMTAAVIDAKQADELGLITGIKIAKPNKSPNPEKDPLDTLLDELINHSPDAVLASKRLINAMHRPSSWVLYQEKLWQTKLILGRNRKLAIKKAKDKTVAFVSRQFG